MNRRRRRKERAVQSGTIETVRALLTWSSAGEVEEEPMSETSGADPTTPGNARNSSDNEARDTVRKSGRKRKPSLVAQESQGQMKKQTMISKSALGKEDADPFKKNAGIPRTPTGKDRVDAANMFATLTDPPVGMGTGATGGTAQGSEPGRGAAELSPEEAMMMRMQTMMANMEKNMMRSLESTIEKSVGAASKKTSDQLENLRGDLLNKIGATEKNVEKLTRRQERTERELEKVVSANRAEVDGVEEMVRRVVSEELARSDAPARDPPSGNGQRHRRLGSGLVAQERREEAYWTARASLQMYPIQGDKVEESVKEFMTNGLGLAREEVLDMAYTATMLPARPAPAIQNVARVVFDSIEDRDKVRRASKNLAGKEMGLRLEIPFHLRKANRTLQGLAAQLKKKNAGLKRNVRLDDNSMGLVMDFSTDGNVWRTVEQEEAQKIMKSRETRRESVRARELEDMLDNGDEE